MEIIYIMKMKWKVLHFKIIRYYIIIIYDT